MIPAPAIIAIGAARRHWKWGVIAALALFSALCWYKWGYWKNVAGVLRIDLEDVRALRRADRANYENAQAAAKALAEAQKAKDAAQYQSIAERTDNAQEATQRRAAADRYARANRVRKGTATASSDAGGTSRAGSTSPAAVDNGPGADADVVVSRTDFDTLVNNTIRLKQAHDYGNELIVAGLATKGN